MAKKGNKVKKLINSAKTPKGFVVGATILLMVAIGAYAIVSFAASAGDIDSDTSTSRKNTFSPEFTGLSNGKWYACYKITSDKTSSMKKPPSNRSFSFSWSGAGSVAFTQGGSVTGNKNCLSKTISNGYIKPTAKAGAGWFKVSVCVKKNAKCY